MMLEKLKGYVPLNLELMGNPINWIIIILMVAIAGVGLAFIFHPNNATSLDED